MMGADDRTRVRVVAVATVVVVMFATLLVRLWFLQVLSGPAFAARSFSNHVRIVSEPAPRGRILDRNGKVLVANRTALAIAVNRDYFPKERARARQIEARLGKLLGMTVGEIDARLQDKRVSPYAPVLIAQDVPKTAYFTVRELPEEFPGVTTEEIAVRTYPLGAIAAHILGYVGEVTADELKDPRFKGYQAGDQIGQSGIERQYESVLRGVPGTAKLEVDATGRVLGTLGEKDPTPGNDVQLSIDADAQKIAEQSLAQGIERARSVHCPGIPGVSRCLAPAGAVVILDAHTGQVIALASAPTFDLRKFVGGVSQQYYSQLNAPGAHDPLLDRALQAAYPPGSTFKPFMATAALQDGTATATGRYPCPASLTIGGVVFHNWEAGQGSISLQTALARSCDTVFYGFADEWWRRERTLEVAGKTPYEIMPDWARRFGFGTATGIDLPGETSGSVPDRAWRKQVWEANKKQYCDKYYATHDRIWEDLCIRGYIWNPGDSLNMSIGQGDVAVTPLQLADAYAAIANGGKLLQPHIALRVLAPSGTTVERVHSKTRADVGAHPEAIGYVQRALRTVPTKGTAAFPFRGWPFARDPVGAKTGSAEILGKQPFSWFAAFGPTTKEGLQYVGVSVVEQAGHGAEVSGPVIRRIMDQLYGLPLTPIVYGGRSD